jgi:hypothetical protein
MTAVTTPFGSAAGKYKFLGDAKLVNCHSELREDNGKARYVISPADGTALFAEVTDTPNRGTIYLEDLDLAYTFHAGRVLSVNSAGTVVSLGVLPGQDKIRVVRNQKTTPQTVVNCDAGVYKIESGIVTRITDEDLPTVLDITEVDGYIVYIIGDGRYFLSELNEAAEVDALDFASAEQASDKLVAGWSFGGFLLLFGQRTIEPHKNTGGADFPFEPMPTVIPRGCIGKWTIANSDNTVMWVGDDGIVYRLTGFSPTRISNHEVERLIQSEADPSVIEAQSWSRAGHAFYELKGTNWSKVYDANTQQWHDRETYTEATWRHCNAFKAWNKVIFGDRLTGNLYSSDETTYTDAGGTQIAKIRFPALNVFPNGGIIDALHMDFLTGQGVTSPSALGFDPKLMLKISKDGGNTYPIYRELKTGKRGAYGRVTTRRLGKIDSQGAVIELSMSDPVGRALAQTDASVRPLKK